MPRDRLSKQITKPKPNGNDNAIDGEFNVWWWDEKGSRYCECEKVNARVAMRITEGLSKGQIVKRIIITDRFDEVNFEWDRDRGVVFPTREDIANGI